MIGKLATCFVALSIAFNALALTWTDPDTRISWNYTVSELGNATVIGKDVYSSAISSSTTGDIVIPSVLNIWPVTHIGTSAFRWCRGLKSVTIPSSVTSIGSGAFLECSGLESVTIPSSVTRIGERAFEECSALESVTIPSSVTSIGDRAFHGCSALKSVTIPPSVTSIGKSVFSSCGGLMAFHVDNDNQNYRSINNLLCSKDGTELIAGVNGNVTIPSSVTSIGSGAFLECSALESVTIPSSVASIGDSAFVRCNGLKSVTIPSSVTSIGDSAFEGCNGLKSVKIPANGMSIGNDAFKGCYSIVEAEVPGWNCMIYDFNSVTNLIISEGTEDIRDEAFLDCERIESVTIPSSVTRIGPKAFCGCSALKSVTMSSGVTSIGMYAFNGCRALTSVTIPSSVTDIGPFAFGCCSGLKTVTIPSGVTTVDRVVFSGCTAIEAFIVDMNNPNYRSINNLLCSKDGTRLILGVNGNVTIPSSVTSIDMQAFYGCRGLKAVTIPSGVTSIGSDAFHDCSGLESVTISASVDRIDSFVFNGCSALKVIDVDSNNPYYCSINGLLCSRGGAKLIAGVNGDVTIPSSVTSVGKYAFADYGALKSVTIPSSVTTIERNAFSGCTELESVTMPSSVWSVGEFAFDGCIGLKTIYVEPGDTSRVKKLLKYKLDVDAVSFVEKKLGPEPEPQPEPQPQPQPEPEPEPQPEPEPEPEPEAVPVLNPDGSAVMIPVGETAPYGLSATGYDGYLVDARGCIVGSVQVKVAKGKVDKKSGALLAAVSATVQMGVTKLLFKKGVADATGAVTPMAVKGHMLELSLGVNGLGGSLDGVYTIDGVRNLFSSKDKGEMSSAETAAKSLIGTYSLLLADGRGDLAVSIAAKGKVKVSGTVDGVKVSSSSQLLLGESVAMAPVMIAKKVNLAFNMIVDATGEFLVVGLEVAAFGRAGGLANGAVFSLGEGAAKLRAALPGLIEECLPEGLSVSVPNGKWVVAGGAKAGKVMLDKATGKIDEAKLGMNPSGLKLTYTAKSGSFKGSFKAYTLEKGKVKSYTVNAAGVMVGEVAYGTATLKKPSVSFSVVVQ